MKSPLLVLIGLLSFGLLSGQSINLLKDIKAGSANGITFVDKASIAYNDQFIFAAEDADHGSEIWISDGTSEGTRLLADINPGTGGSKCQNFYLVNNKVLFTAEHPDYGKEIWTTDGTSEGTSLLKDIFTGSSAPGFYLQIPFFINIFVMTTITMTIKCKKYGFPNRTNPKNI